MAEHARGPKGERGSHHMRTKKLGLSRLDGGAPEGPLRWVQRPHSSRMMAFVSGQRLLTPPPVALSFIVRKVFVCLLRDVQLGFELRPSSTLDRINLK